MESPYTETVQCVIRRYGQENKNTVRIKQAQFFSRIHPVLMFQINIQKYQMKPFFPGSRKKRRAGAEYEDFGVQSKADKLAVQSVF